MITARDYLAAVQQRADAATDGPWDAWEDLDGTASNRGLLTVGIADEVIPEGEVFVETREPDGPSPVAECYVHEDREFIAAARTDVPRLVAALTAALDLCDDPGGPDSWSHMFQGRQSVFVDDIRAAITAALTPKENDS